MRLDIKYKHPLFKRILIFCGFLFLLVPDTTGENPLSDPSASPLLRIDGSAGERYRVLGDFNGDGREDMMLSGDIADIGQTGIKLYLYLRDTTNNYYLCDSIFTKPTTLAVEKFWNAVMDLQPPGRSDRYNRLQRGQRLGPDRLAQPGNLPRRRRHQYRQRYFQGGVRQPRQPFGIREK